MVSLAGPQPTVHAERVLAFLSKRKLGEGAQRTKKRLAHAIVRACILVLSLIFPLHRYLVCNLNSSDVNRFKRGQNDPFLRVHIWNIYDVMCQLQQKNGKFLRGYICGPSTRGMALDSEIDYHLAIPVNF